MRVVVVGGTGFVGRQVVKSLLASDHELRVVGPGVRPTTAQADGPPLTYGDVITGAGLEEAFAGAEVVVNLVAIIRERGVQTFSAVNAQGTANVVQACERAGVRRLVQMSALGADPDPSIPYLFSKWQGEQWVLGSSREWVIFRPSVIFGEGDGFFSQLARAVSIPSPFLVVPGDGSALFQPIAVDDVGRCFRAAVEEPGRAGKVYEIGGPDHLSLDQITLEVAAATGKEWFGISKRRLLHVDPRMLMPGAALMERVMPSPLVTTQQLKLLGKPNATRVDAVRHLFNFEPRPLHGHLSYLRRHPLWWRFESLRGYRG